MTSSTTSDALFPPAELAPVPDRVLEDGLAWLRTVTDAPSGLVRSSRHEDYLLDRDLRLTAGAALARALVTGSSGSDAVWMAAEQCLRRLPVPDRDAVDARFWLLATHALFQRGGDPWRTWNEAMKKAVIGLQRREGDERGSWDPTGPWADRGGRVWATAMMQLCLEVYDRHRRVPGR